MPQTQGQQGASVHMDARDSRMSVLVKILLSVGSTLIAGILIWVGTTLVGIKESLAALAATSQVQTQTLIARLDKNDARDDAQDARINTVDGRVYTLEGRALRGGSHDRR